MSRLFPSISREAFDNVRVFLVEYLPEDVRKKAETCMRPTILLYIFVSNYYAVKKDEVKWEWRKLHNEELNEVNCSPSIGRVIKSRRLRWAGHVDRMEERGGEAHTGIW
jgi:hypothetical protein